MTSYAVTEAYTPIGVITAQLQDELRDFAGRNSEAGVYYHSLIEVCDDDEFGDWWTTYTSGFYPTCTDERPPFRWAGAS